LRALIPPQSGEKIPLANVTDVQTKAIAQFSKFYLDKITTLFERVIGKQAELPDAASSTVTQVTLGKPKSTKIIEAEKVLKKIKQNRDKHSQSKNGQGQLPNTNKGGSSIFSDSENDEESDLSTQDPCESPDEGSDEESENESVILTERAVTGNSATPLPTPIANPESTSTPPLNASTAVPKKVSSQTDQKQIASSAAQLLSPHTKTTLKNDTPATNPPIAFSDTPQSSSSLGAISSPSSRSESNLGPNIERRLTRVPLPLNAQGPQGQRDLSFSTVPPQPLPDEARLALEEQLGKDHQYLESEHTKYKALLSESSTTPLQASEIDTVLRRVGEAIANIEAWQKNVEANPIKSKEPIPFIQTMIFNAIKLSQFVSRLKGRTLASQQNPNVDPKVLENISTKIRELEKLSDLSLLTKNKIDQAKKAFKLAFEVLNPGQAQNMPLAFLPPSHQSAVAKAKESLQKAQSILQVFQNHKTSVLEEVNKIYREKGKSWFQQNPNGQEPQRLLESIKNNLTNGEKQLKSRVSRLAEAVNAFNGLEKNQIESQETLISNLLKSIEKKLIEAVAPVDNELILFKKKCQIPILPAQVPQQQQKDTSPTISIPTTLPPELAKPTISPTPATSSNTQSSEKEMASASQKSKDNTQLRNELADVEKLIEEANNEFEKVEIKLKAAQFLNSFDKQLKIVDETMSLIEAQVQVIISERSKIFKKSKISQIELLNLKKNFEKQLLQIENLFKQYQQDSEEMNLIAELLNEAQMNFLKKEQIKFVHKANKELENSDKIKVPTLDELLKIKAPKLDDLLEEMPAIIKLEKYKQLKLNVNKKIYRDLL